MQADKNVDGAPSRGRETLTFRIGAEEYGVDILRVREIRRYETTTAVPNAPAELKGVMNLRGEIVPILDLRLRFGSGEPRYDEATVTIILESARSTIGWVVDSVSEVLALTDVRPAPAMDSGPNGTAIDGIAVEGDRMILLLDIDRVTKTWHEVDGATC